MISLTQAKPVHANFDLIDKFVSSSTFYVACVEVGERSGEDDENEKEKLFFLIFIISSSSPTPTLSFLKTFVVATRKTRLNNGARKARF